MMRPMRPYLDNDRFVSDAGLVVVRCMSDYGLVAGKLTGASYLETL